MDHEKPILEVVGYVFAGTTARLERLADPPDGYTWVIRWNGMTLNTDGKWELEPQAWAQVDPDYTSRNHYPSVTAAVERWRTARKGDMPVEFMP